MPHSFFPLSAALAACALCAASIPALAQTDDTAGVTPAAVAKQQRAEVAKGNPKRWDRAPRTKQARVDIKKKEIGAALVEARNACRKEAKSQRSECMKEAQLAYQHDMKNARSLAAASPNAEIRERVTPIYGTESPQMGGSAAGATGSGQSGATGTTQSDDKSMGEERDDSRKQDEPLPEDRR